MKFVLLILTLLFSICALACNISEKDLLLRLALMKVDEATLHS